MLAQSEAQQGLFRLWEVQKLDTSTEALVLRPEFESLFTEDERLEARKRLEALNYFS